MVYMQNLQIMGISRIQDVLVVNRSELQEAFETLIQDKRYSRLTLGVIPNLLGFQVDFSWLRILFSSFPGGLVSC